MCAWSENPAMQGRILRYADSSSRYFHFLLARSTRPGLARRVYLDRKEALINVSRSAGSARCNLPGGTTMPRNIVICCDGTANQFAENNTNVVKLYSVLDHNPLLQKTYYHPELGTMEPAGALSTFSRKVTKLLGMAIGYGLSLDIRDAYIFLMQNLCTW
jgi:uncharacterized protein (DUF2235 family)